jgi:uncharacterized protein with HEPN domain
LKAGSSVDEIARRGKAAYLADALLQEAGDSLMMKLGEAANRLSRLGVLAPDGVEWALAVANRNFIIHQYDEINRELTWLTLSRDLPAWRSLSSVSTALCRVLGAFVQSGAGSGWSRIDTRMGPGVPRVGESLGVTRRRVPISRPSKDWVSSTDWAARAHWPKAVAT